jgi:PEP-CTERM motif
MSATITKLSTLTAGVISLMGLSSLWTVANAASIVNGGFETGFAGWTVVDQPGGSGSWFTTGGGSSPLSFHPIPSPTEGTQFAVTDQFGPGSHVLFQDINLEAGSQHILSFDWIAQNWAGIFANPGTVDKNVFPNQQFRVDLVPTGFSDWFGPNSSAGILANILAPVAENAPVTAWNNLAFDLTPWAGSTVRLAFREVDNQSYFNAGIDNVKIASSTSTSVPEPASVLGLLAFGVFGTASVLKRKQQQKVLNPSNN